MLSRKIKKQKLMMQDEMGKIVKANVLKLEEKIRSND
jgi:hypothetical protein